MIVLALDTASALSSVALVDGDDVVAEFATYGPRRHVEEIGSLLDGIRSVVDSDRLDAIACGVGPGPYTGLRVGIAAALTWGAVWGVPVVGVCSLDAVAAAARAGGEDGPVGVALDARRREVYWAAYDDAGQRVAGPRVGPADGIDEALRRRGVWVGSGTLENDAVFGRTFGSVSLLYPYASWVARVAIAALAAGAAVADGVAALDAHGEDSGSTADAMRGRVLLAPRPLYLRRPDVTVPGGVR